MSRRTHAKWLKSQIFISSVVFLQFVLVVVALSSAGNCSFCLRRLSVALSLFLSDSDSVFLCSLIVVYFAIDADEWGNFVVDALKMNESNQTKHTTTKTKLKMQNNWFDWEPFIWIFCCSVCWRIEASNWIAADIDWLSYSICLAKTESNITRLWQTCALAEYEKKMNYTIWSCCECVCVCGVFFFVQLVRVKNFLLKWH